MSERLLSTKRRTPPEGVAAGVDAPPTETADPLDVQRLADPLADPLQPTTAMWDGDDGPGEGGGGPVRLRGQGPLSGLRVPDVQATDPGAVARSGFSGAGGTVPHQAQMEASFGQDFGEVTAHTGPEAQAACEGLGADAYAVGDQVAFKEASPSPDVVAHELTHVVQGQGGPAAHGGSEGIDTTGEGQAGAVERAVAGGAAASTALQEGGDGRPADDPALLSAEAFGFAFELPSEGDLASGSVNFDIGEARSPSVPIFPPLACTARFELDCSGAFTVENSLEGHAATVASGPAAVGVMAATASAYSGSLATTGSIILSFGAGPNLELYGSLGVEAAASVRLQVQPTVQLEADRLVLTGSIAIGGHAGPLEIEHELDSAELFRFLSLRVDGDGAHFDVFELGSDLQAVLDDIDEMIHFDQAMYRNHIATDTDYTSADTALRGSLNDMIIGAQAGNDPAHGEDWIQAARAVHQHLYEGHVSEAVTKLLDVNRFGGTLEDEGVDHDTVRQYVSTMETVIDSRAGSMDGGALGAAAARLETFSGARDNTFSVRGGDAARAREVLRSLGDGNAQEAASRLGFR